MLNIINDYIKSFSTLIAISTLIVMLLFGAIGYYIGLYTCNKQLGTKDKLDFKIQNNNTEREYKL